MFKRVDQKRKKREEEEELGLDQEIKEIMRLNDTDSVESASGSESDSSSDRLRRGAIRRRGYGGHWGGERR